MATGMDVVASREVVINEPLCFIRGRYGRVSENLLREVSLAFFEADKLSLAKIRLKSDIERMQLESWPRVPDRRDGEHRKLKEYNDILELIVFLDQQLILDSLPIYVCEDLDGIPTTKWMDGDMTLIVTKMNDLEKQNVQLVNIVSQLQHRIDEIVSYCDKQVLQRTASASASSPAITTATTVTTDSLQLPYAPDRDPGLPPTDVARGATGGAGVQHSEQQRQLWGHIPAYDRVRDNLDNQRNNRHNHSGSTTGESDGEGGRKEPWSDVISRRGKRFRSGSGQAISTEHTKHGEQWNQQSTQGRRQPTRTATTSAARQSTKIVGTGKQQSTVRIKSSGTFAEKNVFCVSNVSPDVTCDTIVSFLTDNHVTVLSCGDAKTRFAGSKAFRVCIPAKERAKIIDPDIWPEEVIIRDWFFKAKPSQN